jgi:hypothetical protein
MGRVLRDARTRRSERRVPFLVVVFFLLVVLVAVFLFLLILLHRFVVRDPAAPTSGGPQHG